MSNRWGPWDRWMRGLHLYTGMALVPWMTVYALSAFCLNHSSWFQSPQWTTVRQANFTPDAAFPGDAETQAARLLEHFDLAGPYQILGTPDAKQLTIYRPCATGQYRLTWQRPQAKVLVERQGPCSFYSVLRTLHFQSGYRHAHFAYWTWAIVVDLVVVSTLIWVLTGIYIWARRRQRLWGGISLAAGCALFGLLVGLFCR